MTTTTFNTILDKETLSMLPSNFREIGWRKYLNRTGKKEKTYSESELVDWIQEQRFCLTALVWFLEYMDYED